MSNLRQIGMAFSFYLADNDEWFPPRNAPGIMWHGGTGIGLSKYLENPEIFRCPSDPTFVFRSSYLSYGYNFEFLGNGLTFNTRLPQITNPEMILVADSFADGAAQFAIGRWGTGGHRTSKRHGGGSNILWVAGHVSWHLFEEIHHADNTGNTGGWWSRDRD